MRRYSEGRPGTLARKGGDLQGDETLDATATVTVAGLSRDVVVTGKISLG